MITGNVVLPPDPPELRKPCREANADHQPRRSKSALGRVEAEPREGKTSIPDELWSVAVGVARREGMDPAATELRVEWNELKRRMVGTGTARQPALPTFVELAALPSQSLPDCNIELEGRWGRLRIQLKVCGDAEPRVVGDRVIQIAPRTRIRLRSSPLMQGRV